MCTRTPKRSSSRFQSNHQRGYFFRNRIISSGPTNSRPPAAATVEVVVVQAAAVGPARGLCRARSRSGSRRRSGRSVDSRLRLPVRVVHRVRQRVALIHLSHSLVVLTIARMRRSAIMEAPDLLARRVRGATSGRQRARGRRRCGRRRRGDDARPGEGDAALGDDLRAVAGDRRRRLPQPDLDAGRGAPVRGPSLAGHGGGGGALARARGGELRPADRGRPAAGRRGEAGRELAGVDAAERAGARGGARSRVGDARGRPAGRRTPIPSCRRRSSRPGCRP